MLNQLPRKPVRISFVMLSLILLELSAFAERNSSYFRNFISEDNKALAGENSNFFNENNGNDTLYFEVKAGSSIELCVDVSTVGVTESEYKVEKQPTFGKLFTKPNDFCLGYYASHISNYRDTAVISICNGLELCDTTVAIMNIETESCLSETKNDTILLNRCNKISTYCLGIPSRDALKYDITIDGNLEQAVNSDCINELMVQYLLPTKFGLFNEPFVLRSIEINSEEFAGTFDDEISLVNLLNAIYPEGDWGIEGSQLLSLAVEGSSFGNITFERVSDSKSIDVLPSKIIPTAQGLVYPFSAGIHTITLYNKVTGCSKETKLYTICELDVFDFEITKDMPQRINLNDHLDITNNSELSVIRPKDLLDIGLVVDLDHETGVVELSATKEVVKEEVSFKNCNENGCEILRIVVSVGSGCNQFFQIDTLVYNDPDCPSVKDICIPFPFDSLTSSYSITTIDGQAVPFEEGECNSYLGGTGIMVQMDKETSMSLAFTKLSDGCVDTMYLSYSCALNDFDIQLIKVATLDTICIDTEELPSRPVSIRNFCTENSGNIANFELLNDSYCVEVETFGEGDESACIVICDEFGVCDTTIFNARVVNPMDVIANDDSDTTLINTPIELNVIDNDQITSFKTLKIITPPTNGDAIVSSFDKIIYTPSFDYCDLSEPDSLLYEVCDYFGDCDYGYAKIATWCGELNAYDGFSPNGDDVNDCFRIDGLGLFPNHFLQIYNRLGNKVFQGTDYNCDWQGEWNGTLLPDGIYFYILDKGDGTTASGTVFLRR